MTEKCECSDIMIIFFWLAVNFIAFAEIAGSRLMIVRWTIHGEGERWRGRVALAT
jgi:hypothetical protein